MCKNYKGQKPAGNLINPQTVVLWAEESCGHVTWEFKLLLPWPVCLQCTSILSSLILLSLPLTHIIFCMFTIFMCMYIFSGF